MLIVKGEVSNAPVGIRPKCELILYTASDDYLVETRNVDPIFRADFVIGPYSEKYVVSLSCPWAPRTFTSDVLVFEAKDLTATFDLGKIEL